MSCFEISVFKGINFFFDIYYNIRKNFAKKFKNLLTLNLTSGL